MAISKGTLIFTLTGCIVGLSQAPVAKAQEPPVSLDSHIQVTVDLVQLNVAVTDSHGNYVTGLQPTDFTIVEDGIPQKVATFGEGNEPTRQLVEAPPKGETPGDRDRSPLRGFSIGAGRATRVRRRSCSRR